MIRMVTRWSDPWCTDGHEYRTAYRVLSNPHLVEVLLMAWRHR